MKKGKAKNGAREEEQRTPESSGKRKLQKEEKNAKGGKGLEEQRRAKGKRRRKQGRIRGGQKQRREAGRTGQRAASRKHAAWGGSRGDRRQGRRRHKEEPAGDGAEGTGAKRPRKSAPKRRYRKGGIARGLAHARSQRRRSETGHRTESPGASEGRGSQRHRLRGSPSARARHGATGEARWRPGERPRETPEWRRRAEHRRASKDCTAPHRRGTDEHEPRKSEVREAESPAGRPRAAEEWGVRRAMLQVTAG